jgi:hypothetical protein
MDLNHGKFQSLCQKLKMNMRMSCTIQSCGTVLKRSTALRLETEAFINEEGKSVTKYADEKWLC